MADKLFQSTRCGEDEFYARIRDDERGIKLRQRLKQMWIEYQPRAPKGFRKKLQFEFYQRWWEMYVTIGLCHLDLPVLTFSKDDHPDVLLDFGDTKVWVEAVAPKVGTESDAVPKPIINGAAGVPMRECLLRLTQAITSKRKALNSYLQRGVVSEIDAFIIAVSSGALNQFGPFLDWPQPVMLRVLAGASYLVVPLNKSSEPYSERQWKIYRDSGSPVNQGLFYSDKFNSVAGVLYCNQDPLNAPMAPEKSFEFFLNPRGKVKLPKAITERITTWSENSSSEQDSEWKRIQPLSKADT
ncbi:MAG: hypothetical protein J7L34_05825 [Thermotogaceae bacterium]|nr:hypothetical protein [Thermotogaceae bacterium]